MKIGVAVSGGMDSLFCSVLLKEKGYDVVGVFGIFTEELRKIKDKIQDKFKSLNIECIFLDLIDEFKKYVVDIFVDYYLKGFTPNPCCICNKYIKFGVLKQCVMDLGFDYFATGHYAKLINQNSQIRLYRGVDRVKDQSYFLSLVPKDSFKDVKLPLGGYKKDEIRDKLKEKNITPAITSESQEICFIKGNYRDFLKKIGKNLPGPGKIVGMWGDELGIHNGLFNYTIGQRRGLGIPYREPLYVIHKDLHQNILVVGTKKDLLEKKCVVGDVNYLVPMDNWPEEIEIQVNYNMKPKKAFWEKKNKVIQVFFKEKIPRPSPGQICCFYSGNMVLGGGIIRNEC